MRCTAAWPKKTHFLEQPGAIPALRREIDAFAAAEVRAAPQLLVEGIEQPDRIDAGLVCTADAHRADQPAELGQHRVELVLEQRRRRRGAAERAVATIEHRRPRAHPPQAHARSARRSYPRRSPRHRSRNHPQSLRLRRPGHYGPATTAHLSAGGRRHRPHAGPGSRPAPAGGLGTQQRPPPTDSRSLRTPRATGQSSLSLQQSAEQSSCHAAVSRLSPPDDERLAAPRHWRHVNAARIPRRRETSARGAANRHDRREVRTCAGWHNDCITPSGRAAQYARSERWRHGN